MKLGLFSKSQSRPDTGVSTDAWTQALDRVDGLGERDLARLTEEAAHLQSLLATFTQRAEAKAGPATGVTVPAPLQSQVDWTGRPALWTGRASPSAVSQPQSGVRLGDGATLFHDCPLAQISLGQRPNGRAPMRAPYGMSLDVMGFNGGFLSLALDLPKGALEGMTKAHVLTADFAYQTDRPVGIFVRLNLRCGPNTATMLREVPRDGSGTSVEFDLAYSDLDAERLEAAWIDVMFEDPAWLGVKIHDLTLIRSRRAEL